MTMSVLNMATNEHTRCGGWPVTGPGVLAKWREAMKQPEGKKASYTGNNITGIRERITGTTKAYTLAPLAGHGGTGANQYKKDESRDYNIMSEQCRFGIYNHGCKCRIPPLRGQTDHISRLSHLV